MNCLLTGRPFAQTDFTYCIIYPGFISISIEWDVGNCGEISWYSHYKCGE